MLNNVLCDPGAYTNVYSIYLHLVQCTGKWGRIILLHRVLFSLRKSFLSPAVDSRSPKLIKGCKPYNFSDRKPRYFQCWHQSFLNLALRCNLILLRPDKYKIQKTRATTFEWNWLPVNFEIWLLKIRFILIALCFLLPHFPASSSFCSGVLWSLEG